VTGNDRLGLYLMSAKGLAVIEQLLERYGTERIAYVVAAPDPAVEYDGYHDIVSVVNKANIKLFSRNEKVPHPANWLLAVSWRWIIKKEPCQKIIVFHDSLLPRYRGFAPVVTALINGDSTIGVTALLASEEYDCGPIIGQKKARICYPITISQAIAHLLPCYRELATEIAEKLFLGDHLELQEQDESVASYSLWLDEEDYFIDWSWNADRIQRFIDAVGHPYKGAATIMEGRTVRIRACRTLPEVVIENRMPGKVIFLRDGKPTIVCGRGLLEITDMTENEANANLLPLSKFRTRLRGL